MKKFISAFTLYLWFFSLALPAQQLVGKHRKTFSSAGIWASVQFKYWNNAGTGTGGGTCLIGATTCAVTVSAVGAGHTLIFWTNTGHTLSASLSSVSGETTVSAPSFFSWSSADGGQDARYVISATGGETTFTCTQSSISGLNSCGVFEASYSGSTPTYASSNTSTIGTNCTACSGQSLTGNSNALVLQVFNPNNTVTAVNSPFSTHAGFTDDYGVAFAVGISATTLPTWTQTTSAKGQVAGLAINGN